MFHTKKSILTTIFTLFVFSHISALNMQNVETDQLFCMDNTTETTTNTTTTTENSSNVSNYTATETNGGMYTSYIDEDRAVYVEHWHQLDSNDFIRHETPIRTLDDKSYSPDLNNNHDSHSNQYNAETSHESPSSRSQQHDYMEDWIKDNALESRKQEANNNPASQRNAQYDRNHANAIQRQLFEKALDKTKNSPNLANKLSLPIVENYLKQLKSDTATKFANEHRRFLDRKKIFPIEQAELKFLDLLISGEIAELLKQIHDPVLSIAEAAFAKLTELWPWQRDHTFLTSSHVNGTGETGFNVRLGIDIMAIVERDLISRPDYIAQHADAKSFKTIQDFKEKCINLQQKGDRNPLSQEKFNLRHCLFKNGKNDDFAANACYAIVEKIYSDSITNVLYDIVHAQSLEKAHNQLHYLEMQILDQAEQNNITLTDQIKDFAIKQYGFDPIEAAYTCYTSRPDYIKTVNDQPVLSNNNVSPILNNIENKPLSAAHSELTHLQKQIFGTLESLNITDKAIQKELIVKEFGIDILEQANNSYKNRSDHKELVSSFVPMDVHEASINILNNSHDYVSVGQQLDIIAEKVFHNAKLCKLDFVENIENHIIDSIHIIKAPQNVAQFIFNVTVVDHLLTDIQHKANDIAEGKSTSYMQCVGRGSELFTRAIVKFIEGLNPITQVKNIGELLQGAGHLASYAIQHPIDSLYKLREIDIKTCELLVETAMFTSDTIFGQHYLTTEEYQQRCNLFWNITKSVSAENVIDLVAQVAADFAVGKGFFKAFIYIKRIDAATKLENHAAKVAHKLKQAFDIHLGDNPIIVTAEGIQAHIPGAKIVDYMETANPKNIAAKVEKTVENTRAMIKRRGKQGSPYQEISKPTNTRPIDRLKGRDLLGIEDVSVNGYESLPKRIFLNNYEHYLQPELRTTASGKIKPSGWHHDPGKSIERIKRINGHVIGIEKYEKHPSGIYKFRWGVEGMEKKPSTFFPHEWSRETVQQKIVEAYKYARKNHCIPEPQKNGSFAVNGFTKESIKIKIIINQEGAVVTAYPVWPE